MNNENNSEIYFEEKEIKDNFYEQLYALRKIAKLNPVDYSKVLKARKQAENLRELYMKYEPNDVIETNYSVADDLEYSLRRQTLERRVEKDWNVYFGIENDGYGPSAYADDVLSQYIKNQKKHGRRHK